MNTFNHKYWLECENTGGIGLGCVSLGVWHVSGGMEL